MLILTADTIYMCQVTFHQSSWIFYLLNSRSVLGLKSSFLCFVSELNQSNADLVRQDETCSA